MVNAATEINEAVEQLRESGIVAEDELVGCTDDEIREIEQKEDVTLPTAYEEFLRRMGKSAGGFLRGMDFLYPRMIGLTKAARELMAECGVTDELTTDDFAFISSQGCSYLYFDTNAGENPPVYRYIEYDEEPEQVTETFTEWLHKSVSDTIEQEQSP